MHLSSLDLGTAYAAFSLLASFGALWLMQVSTSEAGISSELGLLMLGHRLVLAITSIVLFAGACDTLYSATAPRPVDFAVQFVLVMVITLSALRHLFTPKLRSRAEQFSRR